LKIGIVIPARLNSERLPNKVLRQFQGKSMIEHTWQRTKLMDNQIECVIATDSTEISSAAENFGATVVKTKGSHPNGLSRAKEALKNLDWDYVIILQADEILVVPKDLDDLTKEINNQYDFYNLITRIENSNDLENVNVVKCVLKQDRTILNIFRKNGFISKQDKQLEFVKKICGTFAISRKLLLSIDLTNHSLIGLQESIEQLSVLENNIEILGIEIESHFISVNTEEEAIQAELTLTNNKLQKEIFSKYQ
jgi:3-deoxy-manno-octulosonate cytidylyltransferase (CMP-KDO synthetase)